MEWKNAIIPEKEIKSCETCMYWNGYRCKLLFSWRIECKMPSPIRKKIMYLHWKPENFVTVNKVRLEGILHQLTINDRFEQPRVCNLMILDDRMSIFYKCKRKISCEYCLLEKWLMKKGSL